jgi:hypothetical protein
LEELPDDAIIEQDLRSAPTHPYQSRAPFVAPSSDDEIVELGQDVIVGEEIAAHRPQPRVPLRHEHSSVVISEPHQLQDLEDAVHHSTERTIVVRDRRALSATVVRPSLPHRLPHRPGRHDRALVISASIALGVVVTSLVMWLSSNRSEESEELAVPPVEGRGHLDAERSQPGEPEPGHGGPPAVSVEELPVVRQP